MKIFLTGGAGFIGSHLAKKLMQAGHDVLLLIRSGSSLTRLENQKLQILSADLSERDTIKKSLEAFKPQACVHLAWYAEPGKYLYAPENQTLVTQSMDLLKTLAQVSCSQVLMAGTCGEYQVSHEILKETSPTRPDTPYAEAKLSLLHAAKEFSEQSGLQLSWARFFYLYGPFEDARRLIPAVIQNLRQGKPFPCTPGEQVRDYLHVEDVADALICMLMKQAQGIYNVCSAQAVTIREILEMVANLLSRKDLLQLGALPYREWEPMHVCGDNERLRLLGWKPHYELKEGLAQTIKWWQTKA